MIETGATKTNKTKCKHKVLLHLELAFLACLFRRKSRAIVISSSSSSLLLSRKNFNVAHYSKGIKGINTNLGTLAYHDKMELQDKGHNSESSSFGVMPILIF